MTDSFGIVITAKEIYDAVLRLTGRVDVLITQQNNMDNDVEDHENRLRLLERGRWPLPALAILIAAGTLAYELLTKGG